MARAKVIFEKKETMIKPKDKTPQYFTPIQPINRTQALGAQKPRPLNTSTNYASTPTSFCSSPMLLLLPLL